MNSFNREYKATVFSLLFNNQETLLSLYNALNHTEYTDASGLIINTLKDGGVFMKYRNDVSFLFCSQLTLIEHQSTVNPNMPLRDLFYVSDLLKNIIESKKLYRDTIVRIPMPRFVVLYNGKEERPLLEKLKLSDAFENVSEGAVPEPELELSVTIYNINAEKDSELLKNCPPLYEYAVFIKRLTAEVMKCTGDAEKASAAEAVIDQCAAEGILSEFLRKNKEEVIRMYFWEYDEELARAGRQEEMDEFREMAEKAVRERDDAFEQRDKAFELRDDAFEQRDKAFELRDDAFEQRDQAFELRDKAFELRDQAFELRDQAFELRDKAFEERDNAYQELERIRKELSELTKKAAH